MLKLEVFGAALRAERTRIGNSVAKFAKETAGISKNDIRDFEEGVRAPDKITLKKIVHCFPCLMQFEHDIRQGNYEAPSEVRQQKPTRHAPPKAEPTRLPSPPRQQRPLALVPQSAPRKPKLEIVRQHELPSQALAAPLAPLLKQALRKTRTEMLSELAGTVKKRLASHTDDEHEFTIKNDGKALFVKLQVCEGARDEDGPVLVDSGCYLTVSAKGDGLSVFCRATTAGNYADAAPRIAGVATLLEIAGMLHAAVKDRRFE